MLRFPSLIDMLHSPVLAKYLVALLLLGGLSLVGLVLRWGMRRAWQRWYDRDGASAEGALPPSTRAELPEGLSVTITRVIDGDTFDAAYKRERVRVRVLGLDTPEKRRGKKVQQDAERARTSVTQQLKLGELATERAEALLLGEKVRLTSGREDRGPRKDIYGRYLAYVELSGGKDYGLVMIQKGLGECFGWKYPHPRRASYEAAQRKAPKPS